MAAVPAGLDIDDEGRLYSVEQEDDRSEERVYYGATRLRYDATAQTLHLNGVLTDLDRLRVLARTAPEDFVAAVEEFAESTASQPSREERLESAPEGMSRVEIEEGEGKNRKTVLRWDPQTKLLTALAEIKTRARTEFLAAAAQPDFKAAVDKLYVDSSTYRVSVWWLILFFLVLTMGELCLSPVGLSLVTKLAPAKHVGLFMGGWFLATAIAEKIAQVFGAWWGKMPPFDYFTMFVVMCAVGALLMALLIRPLKRMMHGVQ